MRTGSCPPSEPLVSKRPQTAPGESAHAAEDLARELLGALESHANHSNAEGMARYGISPEGTLGVSMPAVRELARDTKRRLGRGSEELRHVVAGELWASGVHEARILAALLDVPALVDEAQMERWALDLDSWDVCDQLCGSLFDKSPLAWDKAVAWSGRDEEFVKRAGFVLMTQLAVHDKRADDDSFRPFLDPIACECTDDRPMVKKAVNWALRQIGKRNNTLRAEAISVAERILAEHSDSTAARWIARDALRELRSDAIVARVSGR